MRNLRLPSLAILALSSGLLAQTVTVSNVSFGGSTGNVWRAGLNRVQCIYDSSLFTSQGVNGPIVITDIGWRVASANMTAASVAVTYPSVDVFLQDSKVDYASPTVTFSANRSEDPLGTPNFSGPVTTLVQAANSNLPLCTVALTTPFVYVPSSGQDLIIELVINAVPSPATGNITGTSFNVGHLANTVRSVNSTTALSGAVSAFCPTVDLTYNTSVSNAAQSLTVGQGCYNRPYSFYESWIDPNGAASLPLDIDPVGSAGAINGFTMFPVGDNYVVTQNNAPGLSVVPGTGLTTEVVNNTAPTATDSATSNPADDAYWTRALPFSFVYPGNLTGTNQIHISSNGLVWLAAPQTAGNLYSFDQGGAANFAGFVSRPAIAPNWMDLEPADGSTFLGGLGNIIVDTDGSTYYSITWSGVKEWLPTPTPVNLSTCQVVLYASGTVEVRYGAGGCLHSDCSRLVGFSRGDGVDGGTGPSPRQYPDLSVATAGTGYVSGDGARNSRLSSTYRPKVGRPLELVTTNFDPQTVFNIGLISTTPLPGIDLATLGMPGCSAYILLPEIASDFQFVSTPSVAWPVLGSIPAAFAGASVYAQSAQLLSGVPFSRNVANIVVSNGVTLTFDIN